MPKPSFGCLICRQRRIKCDERPGACMNCERYGVLCPGYPRSFDVLHRQHVAIPLSARFGHVELPTGGLPVDNEEFALSVYYASYCTDGSNRCSSAELRQEGNGCLFAAAKLMGYQVMAHKWTIHYAADVLQGSYMAATGLLNAALSSEVERCTNSTLLTVILLGAVETKACTDQSTASWVAHSWGASTLLQIRGMMPKPSQRLPTYAEDPSFELAGPSQVTTAIGSAMFFQATHQIFTSCLLGECRVLPGFVELSRAIERQYVIDTTYPLWRYHWIMIRLIDFLAGLPEDLQRSSNNPMQVEGMIRTAASIQREMEQLFAEASQTWQCRIEQCHDYSQVTSVAHIYSNVTAAQMWNGRRIAVVKLYSAMKQISAQQHVLGLSNHPLLVDENAVDVLNRAAVECLEAAPQVLRVANARMQQSILHDDSKICHDAQLPRGCFVQAQQTPSRLPQLQACLLQWSVYFAAQCTEVDIQVRRSLLYILDYVGNAMHVQQWKLLADSLRPALV